jgi:hypothetical protein
MIKKFLIKISLNYFLIEHRFDLFEIYRAFYLKSFLILHNEVNLLENENVKR